MDADQIKRDETEISFYNPLTKPLTIYSRDENNDLTTYELQPMKMYTFPKYTADHIIKNMKDAFLNENNLNPITENDRLIGFMEKVYGSEK